MSVVARVMYSLSIRKPTKDGFKKNDYFVVFDGMFNKNTESVVHY